MLYVRVELARNCGKVARRRCAKTEWRRRSKDAVAQAKLLDLAQAVELGRVNDGHADVGRRICPCTLSMSVVEREGWRAIAATSAAESGEVETDGNGPSGVAPAPPLRMAGTADGTARAAARLWLGLGADPHALRRGPSAPPRRWATGADSASSRPRRRGAARLGRREERRDLVPAGHRGKKATRRDVIKKEKKPKKAFFPFPVHWSTEESQKSSLSLSHTHTFMTQRGGAGGGRRERAHSRVQEVHHVCAPRLGLCSSLLLEMVWSRRDGGWGGGGAPSVHTFPTSCGHSECCVLSGSRSSPKRAFPFLASTSCAGVTQLLLVSNAPASILRPRHEHV